MIVTSVCPFILALNLIGTVMSCFSTVIVSNDVFTSLGMSIPQEANPNIVLSTRDHLMDFFFIFFVFLF